MGPLTLLALLLSGCTTVDNERIPNFPVQIDLSTPALWNTYGVAGYGEHRQFIRQLGEPRNFPWSVNGASGYGGVLLVSGFNPFTLEAAVPLAFDLACPVECRPEVRVRMKTDGMLPLAICPECGSEYDVCEQAGSPLSGPALSRKLGLKRYECYATTYGGYMISQ